jgi:serine phosphatase RsbU (regulator of sigma subunit)
VRGAFVLVQDISERVEAERRLRASAEELRAAHARAAARAEREALVNRVGQAMRAAAGPGEVLAVAVRELGEAVGADRCYFVSYEPGRDWGRVGPDWHREGAGLSSMAGEYRLSDFAAVSADAAYVAGRTHVIEDIPEHARRVFPDGSAAESVVRLERLGLRALVRAPLAGSAGTFAALVVAMAGGPRRWTDDEITMVEAVAAQARAAVEAARARRDLEEDRAKQRRIAEVLQRALLIAPAPDAFAGAEVFPYYEAAGDEAQVGGDAYDVVRLDGGRVGLCLVDITGHGADAALFSADVRFSARNYLREAGGDPAECLRRLNRHVLDGQRLDGKPENVFVCAIVAVLDPATGALSLAAAGMEPPLILRATSGGVEAVTDVSGPILGALPDWPGAAVGLTLAGGDTLLLYTDGLSEARRGKGDFFGVEGVAAALAAAGPAAPLEAAAGVLVRAAKSFARSGVLDDDLCLLLCRRLGA